MLLVIDNYDSFTFNLVQLFGELGADPYVVRNDAVSLTDIARLAPRAIVLGPGPGTPRDAGVTVPLIQHFGATIPLLGVCLGHQAIGEAYGGRVIRAPRGVMHGKTSRVQHDGTGLFDGIATPVEVMRYHSLVIEHGSLPDSLEITATAVDDSTEIHAVRHRTHPVVGCYLVPNRVESTQCKSCGLARTSAETREIHLQGADVQAVLLPDWLPMSAAQFCRGYGQFNSHLRNRTRVRTGS